VFDRLLPLVDAQGLGVRSAGSCGQTCGPPRCTGFGPLLYFSSRVDALRPRHLTSPCPGARSYLTYAAIVDTDALTLPVGYPPPASLCTPKCPTLAIIQGVGVRAVALPAEQAARGVVADHQAPRAVSQPDCQQGLAAHADADSQHVVFADFGRFGRPSSVRVQEAVERVALAALPRAAQLQGSAQSCRTRARLQVAHDLAKTTVQVLVRPTRRSETELSQQGIAQPCWLRAQGGQRLHKLVPGC